MEINWDEKPDGIAMKDLRDFIRRAIPGNEDLGADLEYIFWREWRREIRIQGHRYATYPTAQQKVKANCIQYLETLQRLGYIEAQSGPGDEIFYSKTDLGAAFASARLKRYTRQAAQRQLDEFLQRCHDLNAQSPNVDQPATICQVDEVILYGSFANQDTASVGDVDVCLRLSVRDKNLFRQYLANTIHSMPVHEALGHLPDRLAVKKLRKGLNILSVGFELPDGITGISLLQQDAIAINPCCLEN
jgi:hypothetical protein